ncbi:MAG: putative Dynein-1-alpha heavy chain, flagellar inner arm I1 complex [Streblomastix strix]|uniref:Putative Dynein-1-alpha heavy chain, flagellar inner arm I1 complex n=1 Tax=Streblomastix strix TaxID=222440 RepID=A0A5J4WEF2_9EUKA|nr:MAG: putative Dynein-1-alpha heavy chain, flagellar inner arm I1 complex [Streblomastix strix]
MFSFQMTLKIMDPQGLINEFQLKMFLKGSLALEKSLKQRPEDSEDWLSETGWEDAIELAQGDPGRFDNQLEELDKNQEQWREWALFEKQEEELPPFLPSATFGYEEGRKSRSEQEQKKEGESGDQEQEQKKESGEGEEEKKDKDKEKEEQQKEEMTGTEVNQVQKADPGRIGGYIDPTQLTELERLCLLRIVRMDRIAAGVTHFVVSLMGVKYVKFPILLYDDVYMRSTALSPVVFIISPGADTATDVIALGERRGFTQPMRLRNISLGQNMEPLAGLVIDQAVTRGQWVLLQNCHLLPNWLKNLEKKLEAIAEKSEDQLDPEFRLYSTSEPTETFPMGILQRSLKVVTETPYSLRMNMLNTYGRLGQDELAKSLHPTYRPMAYVLAFFHAVVQERRKYGKLVWNIQYDFNESDFRVSLDLIATYLNKSIEAQEGLGGPSSVRPNVAVQKSIDAEKAAYKAAGQGQ